MAMVVAADDLVELFSSLWPHLNERDRRLVAAACARLMGRGGVSAVSRAADLSRPTITKALGELDDEPLGEGRVRREGGGRKAATVLDPGLEAALEELVDPDSRGDPESPLRWTIKSIRELAAALSGAGHAVSANTVAAVLRQLGYSLQANSKVLEGAQHADRNAQFEYINEQVRRHLRRGEPVISVDAKKKEKIGNLKNNGVEWQKKGQPRKVDTYDFVDKNAGKVTPYGIYD
ncbi:MAG: ISAzo13 family transposase, partial [Gaiellales bacterium]